MATRKTSSKKGGKGKRKGILEDPPVMVGGGNSVDIIFNNNATNPTGPAGKKKFRLPTNITTVVILDGTNPVAQLVRVSGKFQVSFF